MTTKINKRIKVCDYIANYLISIGIKHIHLLVGGGAASLNDSLCKHPSLEYVCYLSESIASYSAFGEAKYTNRLSILNTTSGIGSLNALPGILSAFCDSVPLLTISGNTALKSTSRHIRLNQNIKLRQMGVQDNDIVEMSTPITKYSVQLQKAEEIAYELEKCVYECTHNRPGPCLIEIPSDIANSLINEEQLKHFNIPPGVSNEPNWIKYCKEAIIDLQTYQKPLILVGGGIRQSNSVEQFKQFIEKYQIPFITTFVGKDMPDNELNLGIVGIKGNRSSNFALQNCDLLLILGSSLMVAHIGYLPDKFAAKSKKIAIDIDADVHRKSFIKLDKVINCDLIDFFEYVNK